MPSSLAETLETILVVDDVEGVLGIVTAILKKAHFRVLSAHSGPAALKLAEETGERIHLVIDLVVNDWFTDLVAETQVQ